MMRKLCVIGSMNMDLVAEVESFPSPGETVAGIGFSTYTGGKGANQAVALGKLGADVHMVGKLGDDLYGKKYIDTFQKCGVGITGIGIEEGTSSGIAVIEVDRKGENHIVIVSGANGKVDKSFIDSRWEEIIDCDIFLLQLEIPLDTVMYTCKRLKRSGKIVILDPAPATALPEELYKSIDFITPNESELKILTGITISSEEDFKVAGKVLLDRGVKSVIAKVGKDGAYIISEDKVQQVKGYRVDSVDTTAAGDSFNAGFAYYLAAGNGIAQSVEFANAVGALSTTGKGAQNAMPSLDDVNRLINETERASKVK